MNNGSEIGAESQGLLAAFGRALSRETHVLMSRPELAWQQLHNRLQWGEGPVAERVAAERKRRSAPGANPWLWRLSREGATGQLIRTLAGHVGEVTGARYSPSGQKVFTIADDGTLRAWDAASGRLVAELLQQEANLLCCDLRGDCCLVVVGDIDGRVLVLSADTGVQIVSFSASVAPVSACSYSPAEPVIAVGAADGALSTWDAVSGRRLASLEGHREGTLGCAFGPTGTTLASVGVDGCLAIHDLRGGTLGRERAGKGAPLYCCAMAPSGELIATGGEDGILRIWDGQRGSVAQSLEGDTPLLSCRFDARGRLLAAGDQDGILRVWQVGTSRPPAVFAGHMAWINACDFAPDESGIITASGDETAKLWSWVALEAASGLPADHRERGSLEQVGAESAVRVAEAVGAGAEDRPAGGILNCAFSDDGVLLATVGFDGRVRIRDVASGERAFILPGHEGPATACAFLAGGTRLVSCGNDRSVMIWDLPTGAGSVLARHQAPVYGCAIDADGVHIGSAGGDGVRLWDARSGRLLGARTDHQGLVYACAFHPSLPLLASVGEDHTVRLWRFEEERAPRVLRLHGDQVLSCAFSPSGHLMATASFDRSVLVWDTETWDPVRALKHHAAPVRFCAFSPDGAWIVSAGWDKTIRVTEVGSGRQEAVLFADGNFMCCAWSPTAALIAAGDEWSPEPHLLELVGAGPPSVRETLQGAGR